MDPFTDMMRAFADGTINFQALVDWYCQWSINYDMDIRLVCRAVEQGTVACSNAMHFLTMLSW